MANGTVWYEGATGLFKAWISGVLTTISNFIGIGSPIASGTPGSVLFVGTGPIIAQDNANFFWDDATNRLGIGTTIPIVSLQVQSSIEQKGRVYVDETATSGVNGPGYGILNEGVFQGGWFYDEFFDQLELWNDSARVLTYPASAAGALGLIGGQLKFPSTQNPSSDSNTLDDYESGNWTPVDVSGAGLTFSSAFGNYLKIGRLVFISASFQYPSTASGLAAKVGGIPFVVGARAGACSSGFTNSGLNISWYVAQSSSQVEPYLNTGVAVTNAQCAFSTSTFAGCYSVA